MNRAVAAWLLRVAERIESLAYLFDDRAWARPPFGVVQATIDTEPLRDRIARLEQRPPAPLPMDDDGYHPDGTHWREAA